MEVFTLTEPTQEMKDWFEKRTKRHIDLVEKYCNIIADEFSEFKELKERAKIHDKSKYEDPEYEPYLWISWKYKCKDDGVEFKVPKNIENKMHEATLHHVTKNSHHPEYHSKSQKDLINKDNRDKPPKEIIDSTEMPDLDIAEMVADWSAMSHEKETSLRSWAEKNINIRWKFTESQKDLIYKILDFIVDNYDL